MAMVSRDPLKFSRSSYELLNRYRRLAEGYEMVFAAWPTSNTPIQLKQAQQGAFQQMNESCWLLLEALGVPR
jgi:hypothetical protein